ncbi:hypothetical protein PoB_001130500 [Plakobranchus ocellatus]|uniref:Uncharacterized protein n=1 Tax=Plakobranchus ocellatus TaxID=259542 RepID=A0AAV3YNU2_9GAST|nr:hypothetical protein PoB_001130500 [Plakobranchus ocellatus]
MAAAKSTLESLWRPPNTPGVCLAAAKSALESGGRRFDSVYAKTTLAQGRITVNKNKQKKSRSVIAPRGGGEGKRGGDGFHF